MARIKSKLKLIPLVLIALIVAFVAFPVTPVYADSVDLFWVNGSGNWSDTAHWATIYTTGQATFTNGDATVEGSGGCDWTGKTGLIAVSGTGKWYTISSITDSDTLEMTGTFAESTVGPTNYVIATTGHAVPTSTNNVYFNVNSYYTSYTVTLNTTGNCADMTWSNPASGTPSLADPGANTLNIYGSLTKVAGMGWTGNMPVHFEATSTGKTITNAGVSFPYAVYFHGVGGGWTFQDTFTTSNLVEITNGTINTNGQTCTWRELDTTSGTNSLILGASTINITGSDGWAGSDLDALDAGTSTINMTNSGSFTGNNKTYYNLNITPNAILTGNNVYNDISIIGTATFGGSCVAHNGTFSGSSVTFSSTASFNDVTFSGGTTTFSNTAAFNDATFTNVSALQFGSTGTFHDLTLSGSSTADSYVSLGGNVTVSADFTTTGYSASRRLLVKSGTLHTARTFTTATVSATNTLFRDITAAGAASWDLSSSTGVGDCCGNTGITFPTGLSIYAVDWIGNGNFSDSTKWSSTSNGTGGTGRVPLPQDIAVFDDHSMQINGVIITFDTSHISGLNTVYTTRNPQFTGTTQYFYNSINLGTCIWDVQTFAYMFGDGMQTLSGDFSYGTSNISIDTQGGSITQIGDINVAGTIYLQSGVWDTGEYDITAYAFDASGTTYTRALWMVNSTFTLTSTGTKWNVASTNLNIDYAGSEIVLTNSTATACTFAGGGMTYNDLTIEGSGNYQTTLTGANVFHTLTIDRTQAAKTLAGAVTATISHMYIPVYGTTVVTITNTDFTKTSGLVASDYLSISGSTASGGATFLAGSHSTNGGSNSGWSFTDATAPTISAAAASGNVPPKS